MARNVKLSITVLYAMHEVDEFNDLIKKRHDESIKKHDKALYKIRNDTSMKKTPDSHTGHTQEEWYMFIY